MNSRYASILLGTVFGLASLLAAPATGSAADLYSAPVGMKDYAPPPPPSSRTWYLKGTIGAANTFVDDIEYAPIGDNFTIHHLDMKSSPFFGLGVGVEANRWLRGDITGEYRGKQLFVGHDSYTGGQNFPAGTNEYQADIESWLFLANAYIDLGTHAGITPYVGAGLGVASIAVEGFKDVNVPNNSVFYGADNTDSNFAWAVYAGLSYDVTPQVTLDVGYRYADLGDVSTGTVTAYDNSASFDSFEINELTSHDLMVSMRWKLDRGEPMAYVPVK